MMPIFATSVYNQTKQFSQPKNLISWAQAHFMAFAVSEGEDEELAGLVQMMFDDLDSRAV